VGHTTHLVAIHLVQNAYLEHQVVDKQKEHTPFHKRDIKTLDALLYKRGFIVQILQREKVACCNKEQWHVELEDESAQPAWSFGMGYHHQDNGQTLGYGYYGVSVHEDLHKWGK
jgi:hypothetical protein